jgi:hypothetical protein
VGDRRDRFAFSGIFWEIHFTPPRDLGLMAGLGIFANTQALRFRFY